MSADAKLTEPSAAACLAMAERAADALVDGIVALGTDDDDAAIALARAADAVRIALVRLASAIRREQAKPPQAA